MKFTVMKLMFLLALLQIVETCLKIIALNLGMEK